MSENCNKREKRKFTFQKPLPDDSKLKKFFQDTPSDNKSKKKEKESQVKVRLNFKRKQGKQEHRK